MKTKSYRVLSDRYMKDENNTFLDAEPA
jgi:hypothetical protein